MGRFTDKLKSLGEKLKSKVEAGASKLKSAVASHGEKPPKEYRHIEAAMKKAEPFFQEAAEYEEKAASYRAKNTPKALAQARLYHEKARLLKSTAHALVQAETTKLVLKRTSGGLGRVALRTKPGECIIVPIPTSSGVKNEMFCNINGALLPVNPSYWRVSARKRRNETLETRYAFPVPTPFYAAPVHRPPTVIVPVTPRPITPATYSPIIPPQYIQPIVSMGGPSPSVIWRPGSINVGHIWQPGGVNYNAIFQPPRRRFI